MEDCMDWWLDHVVFPFLGGGAVGCVIGLVSAMVRR